MAAPCWTRGAPLGEKKLPAQVKGAAIQENGGNDLESAGLGEAPRLSG